MLALAMLLLQGATLWLLDEPSAGLAPDGVAKIMDLVQHVNQRSGVTVLMAEQNLREALRVSHRAYFLKGGSIIDAGAPQNIVEPNLYTHIYSKGS